MDKGTRVRITDGPGTGTQGAVFWWGESKFGDGMRAGVKGDNGETYWVDEENLEKSDGAAQSTPAQPNSSAPSNPNAFSRGDRVRVTKGRESGAEGEIFWWGESKFGDGMRAGIETDAGDKIWASEFELEKTGEASVATDRSAKATTRATDRPEEPDEAFAPSLPEPTDEIPLPDEPPEFDDGHSLAELMSFEDR